MHGPDAPHPTSATVHTGVLASGVPYHLTTDRLILDRPASDGRIEVYPHDITAVQRGGAEVIITCRDSDPLSFMLSSIAAARHLEAALLQLMLSGTPVYQGTGR